MKWKSSKSVVKWNEVKFSEVQCREGGENETLWENVYVHSKVVRSEGLGWKREYSMCGK